MQDIVGRESLLSHDGLHGLQVLADGVARVQLVGHVAVVLAEESEFIRIKFIY